MFVADFIGSPPMNFLRFDGRAATRATARSRFGDAAIAVPEIREDRAERGAGARRSARACPLRRRRAAARRGVRRRISRHHPDRHRRRPSTGTLQARLPSSAPVRVGETVGLDVPPERLSLFDAATGRGDPHRACHEGSARHG